MKKFIIYLLPIILIITSCQNMGNTDENKEASKVPAIKPFLTDVDNKASSHVTSIVDHYIHIQMALVNSNPAEAKSGAVMIMNQMKSFDTLLLTGNHLVEYNNFSRNIWESAESISGISDISSQRSSFKILSDNVYGLVKAFGYKKTLYRVHCPMAFNNQGADWLSIVDEVKNPYYGKDMLECGTVQEAIQR